MDLEKVEPQSRWVKIRHPGTDQPLGLEVNLRPMSDPEVRKAKRKAQNARLRKNKITAEQLESFTQDLCVAAVADWKFTDPELTLWGEQPEFSENKLRKALTKLPWLQDQIDQELDDEAAFFSASPDSSPSASGGMPDTE